MSDLPIEATAPNWAEITAEPQCPLCEYMLRGLNVARCPECGFRFEWTEVLDASRREHPYLFEHHPKRNVWSYFKTVFGAMRPRRFWSRLHPAQHGSLQRLLRFWLLGFLTLALTFTSMPIFLNVVMLAVDRLVASPRRRSYAQTPYWEAVLDSLVSNYTFARFWKGLSIVVFIAGLWPWLTYLGLQVFQMSMRKARVRPLHVLRCMVYGLDLGFIAVLTMMTAVLTMAVLVVDDLFRIRLFDAEWIPVGAAIIAVLLHTDRLGVAYQRYLRFDHPRSVAISAQVITLLTVFTLFVLIKVI